MVRSAFILLLLTLLTPRGGAAGVLTWTTSGPEVGQVTFIRFDPGNPDIVWVGTVGQGIFKSSDGGRTWTAMNKGLIRGWINTIAVDPTNSSNVFIGNELGNIYKTTDGGANWTNISSGLFSMSPGPPPITGLVIHPQSPATLFASTTSRGYLASLGVQKSTNSGVSWSDSGANGLGTKNVFHLAIDPQNPMIMYAGGFFDNTDRPLYKTTNGGSSWFHVSTGLTGGSVYWIAPDPLVSGTLFITTDLGGVRKSTNGGTSWSSTGSGLSSNGCAVLVFEKNSSTNIWCGSTRDVYRTTNGGANWTAAKIGNERISALDVSSNGTLIAGSMNTGLFRRAVGDSTWSTANSGFLASQILALAADPSTAGIVYAGTNQNGLFKSTDHGRTWTRPTTDFDRTIVRSIAIDPKNPNTIYLGTGFTGFYKSTDKGATWKNVSFLSRVYAIAIDPVVTDVIYAGTEFGVSKSTNGGTSFAAASGGQVVALAVDPVSSMNVYASLAGQGVYKSTDGGANWTKKMTGLTSTDVSSIAIDPANASTIFAATSGGGVYKSTNGAENWSESNTGLTSKVTQALWIDSTDSKKLYVTTASSGVFQSTDGGANWSPLGSGAPASTSLSTIAVEPGNNVIHVGANGGVWSFQFRPFEPRITLVGPSEGARIVNGAWITADFSEFTLDCATTGPSGANRGHWRIEVDGVLDSTGCTDRLRLMKTYSLGSHRLTISLRNPDGSPLSPSVEASVNVTIIAPPPRRRAVRR